MKAPGVLLLGSAGRNAGKTGLACEVIRRHQGTQPLVAVKVTTIREAAATCPRGGPGCGVCHEFDGRFSLEEIHDGAPRKDTTRLLEAGAERVFWLRVREEHLDEAVAATLRAIPPDQPSVWESNAARQAIEPGLFLVLREQGNPAMKSSCRRVLDRADRIVEFTGAVWSPEPERVRWRDGRWTLRQAATAVVLAGGQGKRMGQDKNFLPVNGRPLVGHVVDQLDPWFDEVIIGSGDAAKFAFLNRRVVPDREAGQGPLMGLLSCLLESRHELNFVTACDIPRHDPHLLMRLVALADDGDIVLSLSPDGRREPLLAVYRRTIAPVIEKVLRAGGRRFSDLCDHVRVRTVPLSGVDWYRNLNTPEEYAAWLREMDL